MKIYARLFLLLIVTLTTSPVDAQPVERIPIIPPQIETRQTLNSANDSELAIIKRREGSKTAELLQLKEQQSTLLAQLATKEHGLATLVEQNKELHTQLNSLTLDNKILESNRQGLDKRFAYLENQLAEQNKTAETAEGKLQLQVQQLQADLNFATEQAKQCEGQLQKLIEAKAVLTKQLATQSAEKETVIRGIEIVWQELTTRFNALAANKKRLEDNQQGLQIKLIALQNKQVEQISETQTVKDRLQLTKADLVAATEKNQENMEQLLALSAEKVSLANQLTTLTAAKIDLIGQLNQQKQELRQVQEKQESSTADLLTQLATKEDSLAESAAQQKELNHQLDSLMTDKNHLTREQQNLTEKLDTLQKQLAKQQSTDQSVTAQAQINDEQRRLLSAEKIKLAQQLTALSTEKEMTITRLDAEKKRSGSPEPERDLAAREDLVQRWRKAWSEQNVEKYLSCYSADFRPSESKNRAAWAIQRTIKLKRPKFIVVSLNDIKLDIVSPTTTRITFIQSFKSDSYSDVVTKQLEIKKKHGKWGITSEKTMPNANSKKIAMQAMGNHN